MGRFYSFPGMAPSQSEDKRGLSLPDIRAEEHNTQFGEWLKSREETSHQSIGLDPGDKIWYQDGSGTKRPAVVLGEERDQHSGKVDLYFRASDPLSSGTYKQTFEGDTARSLKASRTKRIME